MGAFKLPGDAIRIDPAAAGLASIKVNFHEVDFFHDPESTAKYNDRPVLGACLTVAQVEPQEGDNVGATFELDIIDPEAAALYENASVKYHGDEAAIAALEAWLRKKYRIVKNATFFGITFKPEDVHLRTVAWSRSNSTYVNMIQSVSIIGTPAMPGVAKPEGK